MTHPCAEITAAELASVELFKDDPEAWEWLAERFEVLCLAANEQFVKSGDAAAHFMVMLEGEIHFARDNDMYGGIFIRNAGDAFGVLPFSRMSVYRGKGWAAKPSRIAMMNVTHLRDLVYKAPNLAQKLVNEMIDRSRDATQRDERANKMLALGKLSAGLAHELNNPASAVVRSSELLRKAMAGRRTHAIALRSEVLPPEAQNLLLDLGERIADVNRVTGEIDALERGDREAELSDWLEARHISTAPSAPLIEAGVTVADLATLSHLISCENFEHGLHMLACDQEVVSLTREIEEASKRIADLIGAVKSYSYMDRTPFTEVDVEQGLDVTLRMFQHQLKHGFEVKKLFAGDLPRIQANGSELNQIWTNLIDNAIDAMSGSSAKTLELKTCADPEGVVVDITDSGSGIPLEVQARIFDPFFTTKDVGKGTGLGLDIVHRIVRNHHGSIGVKSVPGRTVFTVRLPLVQTVA